MCSDDADMNKFIEDIADIKTQVLLLKNTICTASEGMKEIIDRQQEILDRHNREIFGEGEEEGLRIKVSGLTQTDKRRSWREKGVIAGLVGVATAFIADIIHRTPPPS